jgi:hypothetical protein
MPSGVPEVQVQPPVKPAVRSRMLWFNGICLALAAAEAQLGLLEPVLPGGLYAWLAFILPVGNALLRGMTSSALTWRRP